MRLSPKDSAGQGPRGGSNSSKPLQVKDLILLESVISTLLKDTDWRLGLDRQARLDVRERNSV